MRRPSRTSVVGVVVTLVLAGCSLFPEWPTQLSNGWLLYRDTDWLSSEEPHWDDPEQVIFAQSHPLALVCSRDDAYATGDFGLVAKWTGRRWSRIEQEGCSSLGTAAWAADSGRLYVMCRGEDISPPRPEVGIKRVGLYHERLWRSSGIRWDGRSWTKLDVEGTARMDGPLWGVDEREVYLVGAGQLGLLMGERFRVFAPPTWRGITAIWGTSGSDLFLGCEGGHVLHHNGSIWTPMELDTNETVVGIWGTASDDVWAWTRYDGIFHWDGERWSARSEGLRELPWEELAIGGASGEVYAVGHGGIARFTGERWTVDTEPENLALFAVCATDRYVIALSSQGETVVRPR